MTNIIKTIAYAVFFTLLLAASVSDVKKRRLPDSLTASMVIVFILYTILTGIITLSITKALYGSFNPLICGVIGSCGLFFPLLILVTICDRLLRKSSLGGGDLKLFAACGLFVPWQQELLFLLLFCFFALCGFIIRKEKIPEASMPLGPCISLAAVITILFGERLMSFLYLL